MKLNLALKIFLAFVLITIASLVLMVTVIRYASKSNFQSYVHKKELQTAEKFAEELSEYYQDHGDWDLIKAKPQRWRYLLQKVMRHKVKVIIPGNEKRFGPGPNQNPVISSKPLTGFRPKQGYPVDDSAPPGALLSPPPQEDHMNLAARISLYDSRQEFLAGRFVEKSESSFIPIFVSGLAVGWVGLQKDLELNHPLDLDFIRQQNIFFYYIGSAAFLLSVLAALWLSRHLLKRVRKLTDATHAITQRRFDTRIEFESSDELGQLAQGFNSMIKNLDDYECRQKQWLADISHELRTPMSILIGEIEALQDGVRKYGPKALDSLRSEAGRLDKIIRDLHDLSMADAGSFTIKFQPVRPIRICEQIIEMFKTQLDLKGMDVKVNFADAANILISGDADRLRQLFSNLLQNVLRHSDDNGKLKISQKINESELIILLEDSGPGVCLDEMDRLFDRLFRVDRSRSRSTGGSGIGLSICKQIVQAHGGHINAKPSKIGGLCIEIVFYKLNKFRNEA
ncbi:MAG: HAMP domain-containing protein [Desulfobacteraceae bacterium]|nr:HAMP domain-containing protein [Desulfobacteraceae bacterium]